MLSQSLKKREDGLRLGADHYSAYDRVLASDVRYRFVIDTSTLQ